MGSSTRKIIVSGLIASFVLFGLLVSGVQAQEKVVLRYADTTYGKSILTQQTNWIESFMVRYPYIDVRAERVEGTVFNEKYVIQAAAQAGPDIVWICAPSAKQWIKGGFLINLVPYIEENEALADMDDFFEAALGFFRYEGGLYGLPMDLGPEGIHKYNVDLFDEAGLEHPKRSWTFEGEFLKAAKRLTKDTDGDGEVDQWGMGGSIYEFYAGYATYMLGPSFLFPFGGKLVNDSETECLLTEPESLRALNFWIGLIHEHHVAPPYEIMKAMDDKVFALGKSGMAVGYPWDVDLLAEFTDLHWDAMHAPKGPVRQVTEVLGSGYCITQDSKHPDEAWLFLRDYMSREGLTYIWALSGSGCCARESAWVEWEKEIHVPESAYIYREALDYGTVPTLMGPATDEVLAVASEELVLCLMGKTSVEEMAGRIKAKVDPILERAAEE